MYISKSFEKIAETYKYLCALAVIVAFPMLEVREYIRNNLLFILFHCKKYANIFITFHNHMYRKVIQCLDFSSKILNFLSLHVMIYIIFEIFDVTENSIKQSMGKPTSYL